MESNIKTCNFCNGNNLVSDLIVEVINDTGNIGFHYESESKSYFNTNSEKYLLNYVVIVALLLGCM